MVQTLLSFSRQRKPQNQPVDVRKVLEETFVLRGTTIWTSIAFYVRKREIAARIPAVIADAHQLEQVFPNIVNNALTPC